jgi:ferrochelatase
VLYDLDLEARQVCHELGLGMIRSGTVGVHPRFVGMLRGLIEERIHGMPESSRQTVGRYGPGPDVCSEDCCLPPSRPLVRPAVAIDPD